MKIILDTNFLIDCIRFKIDIKSEFRGNELFIVDSIILEIEKIAKRKTKEASLAKIALDIINDLKVLKSKQDETDDSLIEYSKEGYVIATQDRDLKSKIKKLGGKVIYIRQKKYVVSE
jgi:rRNA-processing protein FCF1